MTATALPGALSRLRHTAAAIWERSPTARLDWGISLSGLLLGFGGAALSTGEALWIAAFLVVLATALVQLAIAGPAHGRLWYSPLTKALYVFVALWSIYVFGNAAIETGEPFAIVPLVAIVGVVAAQSWSALRGRASQ